MSRRNSRHNAPQSHLTTESLFREAIPPPQKEASLLRNLTTEPPCRRKEPVSHMKILILGGGFQQLPAIRKAHELGLTVLLADYLPDAPGRREADQSFLISTRDKDKILELARMEAVDGILAFASDSAEKTAAYVEEKMGLPGGMYVAAGILGNM